MSGHQSSVIARAVCRSCSGCSQLGRALSYRGVSVPTETGCTLGYPRHRQMRIGKCSFVVVWSEHYKFSNSAGA